MDKGREIVHELSKSFEMKVMFKPKLFLGVEISVHGENRVMNQSTYIWKLAKRFGIDKTEVIYTPMETRLKLKRTGIRCEYPGLRALIGGLLFVARSTRPDILFPVNYLSRFQSEGTKQIFKYALRILRYLVSTVDYSLVYHSDSDESIVAYVDASFADVQDTVSYTHLTLPTIYSV